MSPLKKRKITDPLLEDPWVGDWEHLFSNSDNDQNDRPLAEIEKDIEKVNIEAEEWFESTISDVNKIQALAKMSSEDL